MNKKGFTLVELLVAIAIIGILVAFLLHVISMFVTKPVPMKGYVTQKFSYLDQNTRRYSLTLDDGGGIETDFLVEQETYNLVSRDNTYEFQMKGDWLYEPRFVPPTTSEISHSPAEDVNVKEFEFLEEKNVKPNTNTVDLDAILEGN